LVTLTALDCRTSNIVDSVTSFSDSEKEIIPSGTGQLSIAQPIYHIPWADSCKAALMLGRHSGSIIMDGTQTLRLTPATGSNVTGSLQLTVVAWMYGVVELGSDGVFVKKQ